VYAPLYEADRLPAGVPEAVIAVTDQAEQCLQSIDEEAPALLQATGGPPISSADFARVYQLCQDVNQQCDARAKMLLPFYYVMKQQEALLSSAVSRLVQFLRALDDPYRVTVDDSLAKYYTATLARASAILADLRARLSPVEQPTAALRPVPERSRLPSGHSVQSLYKLIKKAIAELRGSYGISRWEANNELFLQGQLIGLQADADYSAEKSGN
jgi:hypothetical protein